MFFSIFLQVFVYSLCVNSFIFMTYVFYYADQLSTNLNNLKAEYDYVIVGSGTAGSLIATRISRETNFTYIVLEAGGHSNWILDIPVFGPLLHGSLFDWQYKTVPQDTACLAMKDKRCRLPQGRIVGGSSKLNNMVHVRGNMTHYKQWFHGKYTEEYLTKHMEFVEEEFLHLNELQYETELANAFIDAAIELEYHNNDSKSFRKSLLSQKSGKRWTTNDNIELNTITNALVDKVLISKDNKAKGVSFIVEEKNYKVLARNAVILSAGTYNTPKILQLSGIGPVEVLKPLGIPVIKDLPVGKNLQDHVTTGLDLIMFNKPLKISPLDVMNPYNVFKYLVNGIGPLTSPGCEAVGFVSTSNLTEPDLEYMVLPVGISADRGAYLRKAMGINDIVWEKYFANTFDKHTASILPILLHPKSKGEVYIKSKDIFEPPIINPKYFYHPDDIKVIIKGLKMATRLVESEAMKNLGANLNPSKMPGCEAFEFISDEYWECYIRHLTLTSYHPVGTCSMGLPSSKTAVVDTSFNVIGVKNLFVVDGSVLPTLPSGNINAAIALMASLFFDATFVDTNEGHCDSIDIFHVNVDGICLKVL